MAPSDGTAIGCGFRAGTTDVGLAGWAVGVAGAACGVSGFLRRIIGVGGDAVAGGELWKISESAIFSLGKNRSFNMSQEF
jgi:hypothetical protein